ncbi:hypothetical protein JHK84_050373 [Glycine max]|nr:hypothetical protein JHK86_050310 [Glycine max]KAG4924618.1 hypothetical protein JHK87_050158 [Glycine soja]KAG5094785.1 hypothetical protein JHK84_050373 [Glycine max]
MKKAIARGSKAKQKAKKRQVEEKAIAGVSVTSQLEDTKVSKAKQRRDKRSQQEAEREQRIQAEQSDIISDRVIENKKLENKFLASWLDCL